MKRVAVLLFFFFYFSFLSMAQQYDVLAILFDNSGSMKDFFSETELNLAKEQVLDLVFNGQINTNNWKLVGRPLNAPLWDFVNGRCYIHAFGEFGKDLTFMEGNYAFYHFNDIQDARNTLSSFLDSKLDFKDKYTNIDLAKQFAWFHISNNMASGYITIHLLLITDDVPDPNIKTRIVKSKYEDPYIEAGCKETEVFKLSFIGTKQSNKIPLKIFYKTIEYNNISQVVSNVTDDENIILDEDDDFQDVELDEDISEDSGSSSTLLIVMLVVIFVLLVVAYLLNNVDFKNVIKKIKRKINGEDN